MIFGRTIQGFYPLWKMSEDKKSPRRLPSIYNNTSDAPSEGKGSINTTLGGAQKLKFAPTVPSTRTKKEPSESDFKKEQPQIIHPLPKGDKGRGRVVPTNQLHQAHSQHHMGIFSEGPAAFNSGVKALRQSSSTTVGAQLTLVKSEPSSHLEAEDAAEEIDSAIDMREIFSAIDSLHTPLIIDNNLQQEVDDNDDTVQIPTEGQLFITQLPFPIDKLKQELSQSRQENDKKKSFPAQILQQKTGEVVLEMENLPETSTPHTSEWHWTQKRGKVGFLRTYESGCATLTINGIEFELESNIINLRNNFKVVQMDPEREIAVDFGPILPKQLTASYSGEYLINNL